MTHEETFNSFISELSEPWREKLKENGCDATTATFYNGLLMGVFEKYYLEFARTEAAMVPLSAFNEILKRLVEPITPPARLHIVTLNTHQEEILLKATKELNEYEAKFHFIKLPDTCEVRFPFEITPKIAKTTGKRNLEEHAVEAIALAFFCNENMSEDEYRTGFYAFFWYLAGKLRETEDSTNRYDKAQHALYQELFNKLCTAKKNQKFLVELFEKTKSYLDSVGYFSIKATLIQTRAKALETFNKLSEEEKKLPVKFTFRGFTYLIDLSN